MIISQLITYLEEAKEEHGDIEVRVQYRDEGGEWEGYDEYIYAEVCNDEGEKIFLI